MMLLYGDILIRAMVQRLSLQAPQLMAHIRRLTRKILNESFQRLGLLLELNPFLTALPSSWHYVLLPLPPLGPVSTYP